MLDAGIQVVSAVTAPDTIDGCTGIVDVARRTDVVCMIAGNCICRPLFRECEVLVWSGKLGEIIHAEPDYIHPIPALLVDSETGRRYWRIATGSSTTR